MGGRIIRFSRYTTRSIGYVKCIIALHRHAERDGGYAVGRRDGRIAQMGRQLAEGLGNGVFCVSHRLPPTDRVFST